MTPIPAEPVHLIEDAETGDRFLIYGTDKGIRIELKYDGDTLWMTQAQMASLFGVDRSVVTKHLSNIYEEGELDPESTSAKIAQVRREGPRDVTRQVEHYNLDAIISVGYRVSSRQGTQIRKWATEKLVQFATKGFVIDVERLKAPGGLDRINELREIIRDIRSDEANLYSQIRHLFTLCNDYDPKSQTSVDFYAKMQAKMVWAVTTHTPSELIISRANADHTDMGLRAWKGDHVRQADAEISKNYLIEQEVRELNRLTTIMLDVFEDGLDIGKISAMSDMEAALDHQGLSRLMFIRMIGTGVPTVVLSTWKLRAEPLRSTRVKTMLRNLPAAARQVLGRALLAAERGLVHFHALAGAAMGVNSAGRMVSRIRWLMNQAVLWRAARIARVVDSQVT